MRYAAGSTWAIALGAFLLAAWTVIGKPAHMNFSAVMMGLMIVGLSVGVIASGLAYFIQKCGRVFHDLASLDSPRPRHPKRPLDH